MGRGRRNKKQKFTPTHSEPLDDLDQFHLNQTRERSEFAKQRLRFDIGIDTHPGTVEDKAEKPLRFPRETVTAQPARRPASNPQIQTFSYSQSVFGTPPAPAARRRGVSICESRKERREVIHATGKSGLSGQQKPRWKASSRIKCKG